MAGETLLGSMVTLPSPAVAEILAEVGFDWLFIDGEHGPLETAEVLAILQRSATGLRVSSACPGPRKHRSRRFSTRAPRGSSSRR